MVQESNNFSKIIDLMKKGKIEAAQRKLMADIDPLKMSGPNYLETVFTIYLRLFGNPTQNFLKHLKITKVPPNPIDTKYDIGRRFFYALYLLNKSGGMRLVHPYLQKIQPNRILEYRFLGGMYFYNYDYNNARLQYEKAFSMLPSDFKELEHLHICGNLGSSNLYLENYDNYEKVKKMALDISDHHHSVNRVFKKYDLLKCYQTGDKKGAAQIGSEIPCLKSEYDNHIPIFERILIDHALSTGEEQKDKLIKNLNTFKDIFEQKILSGKISPERYFGLGLYLDSILEIPSECDFIRQYKRTSYPYPSYTILGRKIDDNYFKEKGHRDNLNFINAFTQEYNINGKKGIGLNNELRAAFNLIRADYFGLSFETLASLIYSHEDFAGLFLIKDRIKQIIYRLKNHYNIDVKAKNYRAFASKEVLTNIYISKNEQMIIKNNFSISDFMEFYEISQSKAKIQIKRLLKLRLITSRLVGRRNIYSKKE